VGGRPDTKGLEESTRRLLEKKKDRLIDKGRTGEHDGLEWCGGNQTPQVRRTSRTEVERTSMGPPKRGGENQSLGTKTRTLLTQAPASHEQRGAKKGEKREDVNLKFPAREETLPKLFGLPLRRAGGAGTGNTEKTTCKGESKRGNRSLARQQGMEGPSGPRGATPTRQGAREHQRALGTPHG